MVAYFSPERALGEVHVEPGKHRPESAGVGPVIRNEPCSREASSAELTPLPDTSVTTALQYPRREPDVEVVAAHLVGRKTESGGLKPAG